MVTCIFDSSVKRKYFFKYCALKRELMFWPSIHEYSWSLVWLYIIVNKEKYLIIDSYLSVE